MTKMTDVIAVLRSLERRGLVESRLDADGEVYWWFTAKATPQAMRDWQDECVKTDSWGSGIARRSNSQGNKRNDIH